MERIELLLYLAEHEGKEISTAKAGKGLGCSQQNASRLIKELQREGFLIRQDGRESAYRLLPKARRLLDSYGARITRFLKSSAELRGRVVSGSGEGRFYTGLAGYSRQFRQKLNLDIHPGTLNLASDAFEIDAFLHDKRPVHIDGFSDSKRSYGSLAAYFVKIEGLAAAAIRPERTHHRSSVLELISEYDLRKSLNLEDGKMVIVR